MRHGLIAVVGLLLAGCQVHGPANPSFVLTSLGGDPTSAVDPTSRALPAKSTRVTINFASVLPKARRLQAKLADVAYVDVKLSFGSTAGPSQRVLAAAIAAGQTTVVFSGVQPGAVTYTITAGDASNHVLGTTTGTVQVVAGQTVTVNANVALAPTDVPPAGGGSGAGGTVATTGTVTTNVTIVDGVNAQPLTQLAQFTLGASLLRMAADAAGTYWGTSSTSSLYHFDATGQILGHFLTGVGLGGVGVSDTGDIWVADIGFSQTGFRNLYHLGPDGSPRATISTVPLALSGTDSLLAMSTGTGGAVWVNSYTGQTQDNQPTGFTRIASDGTVTTFPMVTGFQLAGDHAGGLLILGGTALMKYDANGQLVWQEPVGDGILLSPNALAVGPANDVWVANTKPTAATGTVQLVHLAANGDLLGRSDLPAGLGALDAEYMFDTGMEAHVLVDAGGNAYPLWPGTKHLAKYTKTGALAGVYYLPNADMAETACIDPQGRLVVQPFEDATHPIRIYQLL